MILEIRKMSLKGHFFWENLNKFLQVHNTCEAMQYLCSMQMNFDLRNCDLRKNLDLRKIVATTKILVNKLFDLG